MSMKEGFIFDPRAFWGDDKVKLMTYEQAGVYLRLLSMQWESGSLSSDPETLSILLREGKHEVDQSTLEGWLQGCLKACFTLDGYGSMANDRLAGERIEWRAKKDGFKESGRRGGRARAANAKQATVKPPLDNSSRVPQPSPLPSSPLPSSPLPSHPVRSDPIQEDLRRKCPGGTNAKCGDPLPENAELCGFCEFWAVYPKPIDKGPTREAWNAAKKRPTWPGDEEVIANARVYRAERIAETGVTNGKTTLHSKRWLKNDRHLMPADPVEVRRSAQGQAQIYGTSVPAGHASQVAQLACQDDGFDEFDI